MIFKVSKHQSRVLKDVPEVGSGWVNGLGFQWVRISPTYKWEIHWGYNPLILTIDPNFQLPGHPLAPGPGPKTLKIHGISTANFPQVVSWTRISEPSTLTFGECYGNVL